MWTPDDLELLRDMSLLGEPLRPGCNASKRHHTSRVVWDDQPVTITANEAIQETASRPRERVLKVDEAMEFLRGRGQ